MLRLIVLFFRALPIGIVATLWLLVLTAPFAQDMLNDVGSRILLPGGFVIPPSMTFIGVYLIGWAVLAFVAFRFITENMLRED